MFDNFSVAAIFSDSMVLQRGRNIRIFGHGVNGESILVTLGEKSVMAKVKEDGSWCAILPPFQAMEGLTLTVCCKDESFTYRDIAIGEVWLAGGQSNMEFEIYKCSNMKEIINDDIANQVRFYQVSRRGYLDETFEKEEKASKWQRLDKEECMNWSAVGFLFAKKLALELGVTIGVIGCNLGGTSASAWVSKERLLVDCELSTYFEECKKFIDGKTIDEQVKEYEDYVVYQEKWDEMAAKCYGENPDILWEDVIARCGELEYPGPMNLRNPLRPAGLYECMIKRIAPYTLGGVIYYQGESDDHKPQMYYKLLTSLIRQWRQDFEDIKLPFLMVQLPMHRYAHDEDRKNWCYIREVQMQVYQTIKNIGIAVALDCGEFNEIHPKDKTKVGERLALQALYQVYHKVSEKEAFGPIYRTLRYEDNGIYLSFDHAEDGFLVKGNMSGFEIAGEDMIFVEAKARIDTEEIYVYSERVDEPKYVRYCWYGYQEVTLFGKNGIPVAPFRTYEGAFS